MYIPIECTPISSVSPIGELYQSDVASNTPQILHDRVLPTPSSDFRVLKSLRSLALNPYRLNFTTHEVLGGTNSLEPEGSLAKGDSTRDFLQ